MKKEKNNMWGSFLWGYILGISSNQHADDDCENTYTPIKDEKLEREEHKLELYFKHLEQKINDLEKEAKSWKR